MSKEVIVRTGVGISMIVAGAALGAVAYFLQKKKLEEEFEKRLRFEVEETKNFYAKLHKKETFDDPSELAKVYEETVEDLEYVVTDESVIAAEEAARTEEEPYIISWEEFAEALKDYDQATITYFEGDDVLSDERDTPIDYIDATVGAANLSRFGHRSKDNNIVYIRNDRLALDFEVVRSKGSYAKEVLGYIEHSEPRGRPRKFRRDDE